MTPGEVVHKFKLEEQAFKRWFLEQCLGIANALAQMHALSYHHRSILPESIFWYRGDNSQSGTLSLGHLTILDDTVEPSQLTIG